MVCVIYYIFIHCLYISQATMNALNNISNICFQINLMKIQYFSWNKWNVIERQQEVSFKLTRLNFDDWFWLNVYLPKYPVNCSRWLNFNGDSRKYESYQKSKQFSLERLKGSREWKYESYQKLKQFFLECLNGSGEY